MGLVAAAFYGTSDFMAGLAAKRTTALCVTVISQSAGFVLLLAIVPFFAAHASRADLLWGLAAGFCGGLGIALLYHALSIGTMGVVSPITAVIAAGVPVVAGLLRGDPLAWYQYAGICVALVAVVMISLSFETPNEHSGANGGKREIATAGVREAMLSGLLIGGFFLLLSFSQPGAALEPLLAARLGSSLLLLAIAAITRTSLRPARGTWVPIVLAGALDMTANALYLLATYHGALAIAAVLTSLYPAATVALARVVLKERLGRVQLAGVGVALAGVVLIAL
jgi:drug/metabolite transporter (DMT)-like permease